MLSAYRPGTSTELAFNYGTRTLYWRDMHILRTSLLGLESRSLHEPTRNSAVHSPS